MNFTDWQVAGLSARDNTLSNSSGVRNNGRVHGNGNWSLWVPESCCVEVLRGEDSCGWDVLNGAESRLNHIQTEARLSCAFSWRWSF